MDHGITAEVVREKGALAFSIIQAQAEQGFDNADLKVLGQAYKVSKKAKTLDGKMARILRLQATIVKDSALLVNFGK